MGPLRINFLLLLQTESMLVAFVRIVHKTSQIEVVLAREWYYVIHSTSDTVCVGIADIDFFIGSDGQFFPDMFKSFIHSIFTMIHIIINKWPQQFPGLTVVVDTLITSNYDLILGINSYASWFMAGFEAGRLWKMETKPFLIINLLTPLPK